MTRHLRMTAAVAGVFLTAACAGCGSLSGLPGASHPASPRPSPASSTARPAAHHLTPAAACRHLHLTHAAHASVPHVPALRYVASHLTPSGHQLKAAVTRIAAEENSPALRHLRSRAAMKDLGDLSIEFTKLLGRCAAGTT